MAELFLQDLSPQFLVRPVEPDFLFDFMMGFANPNGGVNTIVVEVKAVERPVADEYVLSQALYEKLANSNVPAILLVVDVKLKQFYFAWLNDHKARRKPANGTTVRVPMTLINESTRAELIKRMSS